MNLLLTVHFLTGQLLDVTTTYVALRTLGLHELNPVASALFSRLSVEGVMIFKLIFSVGIALLQRWRVSWRRALIFSVRLSTVVVWGVVCINIITLLAELRLGH